MRLFYKFVINGIINLLNTIPLLVELYHNWHKKDWFQRISNKDDFSYKFPTDPLFIDTDISENYFENRLNITMEELILSAVLYKDFLEIHRERFEFDNILDKTWKYFFPISEPFITHRNERVAIRPDVYTDSILPFYFEAQANKIKEFVEYINPWRVIGGQFNKYSNNQFRQNYNCDEINKIYYEDAIYHKIEPFGIYVALEGKNRVKLFRMKGKLIKAKVKAIKYFSPENLEIIFLKRSHTYYLYHKDLDEKKLILFPHISVPLLRKYGVKFSINFKDVNKKKEISNILSLRKNIVNSTMYS